MSQQLLIVIALALAGYVLLLLEIFIVPGFGVAGVMGLLGLAAASVSAIFFFGGFVGGLIVLGVIALTSLILWMAPRTRAGKNLIHRESLARAHAAVLQPLHVVAVREHRLVAEVQQVEDRADGVEHKGSAIQQNIHFSLACVPFRSVPGGIPAGLRWG